MVIVGGKRRASVAPSFFSTHSWSPDGARVVFAVVPPRTDVSQVHSDLYIADAAGHGVHRLTTVGNAIDPVWSPAGAVIVYGRAGRLRIQRQPPGYVLAQTLWAIRPDGSGLRRLEPDSTVSTDTPSGFSPDGSTLLFTRAGPIIPVEQAGTKPPAVWALTMGSDAQHVLIPDASQAAFSTDGKRIAFASARDSNGALSYGDSTNPATELYVANSDGSNPVRLTFSRDVDELNPAWSPDGQAIVYQRGRVVGNAEAYSVWQVPSGSGRSHAVLFDRTLNTWYGHPVYRHANP
jgi:Tol biopolymer transport system component